MKIVLLLRQRKEEEGWREKRPLHLEVSVDNWRLALVQAGHGLAGVTEDVQDLGLTEAHIQPLVHLLHHLTRCRRDTGHRFRLGNQYQPACLVF